MNSDDIIVQLLDESNGETTSVEVAEAIPIVQQYKRERLVALAAGQTEVYLGKTYSIDQIESFQESTVTMLYARHEAHLGSIMTKILGRSALELLSPRVIFYQFQKKIGLN